MSNLVRIILYNLILHSQKTIVFCSYLLLIFFTTTVHALESPQVLSYQNYAKHLHALVLIFTRLDQTGKILGDKKRKIPYLKEVKEILFYLKFGAREVLEDSGGNKSDTLRDWEEVYTPPFSHSLYWKLRDEYQWGPIHESAFTALILKVYKKILRDISDHICFSSTYFLNLENCWINDYTCDFYTKRAFVPFRELFLQEEKKIRESLQRIDDSPNSSANMHYYNNLISKNPAGPNFHELQSNKFFKKMVHLLSTASYYSLLLFKEINHSDKQVFLDFFEKYSRYNLLQYMMSISHLLLLEKKEKNFFAALIKLYINILLSYKTYNNWEMIKHWELYENGEESYLGDIDHQIIQYGLWTRINDL